MTLTGKQIQELGIVTNLDNPKCIQQQGVDVEVKSISVLTNKLEVGFIPTQGKTIIPKYSPLPTDEDGTWVLEPGWYEVELKQGCDMKDKFKGEFKTRSSLVRCGAVAHSGQYDAGFHTSNMGCFLDVRIPIRIEQNARIAQFIVEETDEVENTYNGQWQNDIQRTTQK